MLDPAVHSLEYMNNFMLLGCLIGFCGTVNLSKLIRAWVFFQDQAVASISIVGQRKKFTVTVDEATHLGLRVSGLLSPRECSHPSYIGAQESHLPGQQLTLQVLWPRHLLKLQH